MVITNWRQTAPTVVHQYGIDYKLLKGQADSSPDVPNYCMWGILYATYAILQTGKSYEAHAHGDHEKVYYIITGHGTMTINGERQSIQDGDAIFIPAGDTHSISNTGEEFLVFLAFAAQVPEDKAPVQGRKGCRMRRKKAVVTDGSHRIGRRIVYCLAEAGYDVVFSYNTDFNPAQHMLETLAGQYPDGIFDCYQAKLTEQGAAVSFFRQAVERLDGLDLIVNNASVTKLESIFDLTEGTMDYLVDLMLCTYVLMMREAAAYMANQGTRDNIISISSTRGLSAHPSDVICGGIKAVLNRIVQSVTLDIASYGIRANNILPGAIGCFMPEEEAKTGPAHLEKVAYLLQHTPLERYGTPEDMGNPVVFLASGKVSYITGQSIVIDGGLSLPGLAETAAETAASGWGRVKKEIRQQDA